jgi:hypothetical protein
MPMITVNTLPLDAGVDKGSILKKLVSALAAAIDAPEEKIFAGWNTYDSFVDSMDAKTNFSSSSHPPIVKIDLFEGREETKKDKALNAITATIKTELDFAGNPFVYMTDIMSGHINTGGKIIKK